MTIESDLADGRSTEDCPIRAAEHGVTGLLRCAERVPPGGTRRRCVGPERRGGLGGPTIQSHSAGKYSANGVIARTNLSSSGDGGSLLRRRRAGNPLRWRTRWQAIHAARHPWVPIEIVGAEVVNTRSNDAGQRRVHVEAIGRRPFRRWRAVRWSRWIGSSCHGLIINGHHQSIR